LVGNIHIKERTFVITKTAIMMCNNKKRKIIQAVEKLAARQRLYEITLDDVVKEAKIGKGTIYHYFRNKEDLFFEVATNGFDELCEIMRPLI